MYVLYILISRSNPESVDQPWITRRNAGLLQAQTLDQARSKPWIIDYRPAGKLTHSLPTFDKPNVGGRSSRTLDRWRVSCTTRSSERLSKRANCWLAGQIEHDAKKWVGWAYFPGALPQRWLSDCTPSKFARLTEHNIAARLEPQPRPVWSKTSPTAPFFRIKTTRVVARSRGGMPVAGTPPSSFFGVSRLTDNVSARTTRR
jgi:hypothetical protein